MAYTPELRLTPLGTRRTALWTMLYTGTMPGYVRMGLKFPGMRELLFGYGNGLRIPLE